MTDLSEMAAVHDPGGKSKPKWKPGSLVTARFGGAKDCYRYELHEQWDASLPAVMFCLMNPSTATIENADPTLIRTGNFARSWGYGAQYVGNIHAYRATDSIRLLEADDPVGPENDMALLSMAQRAALVVLAFGQVKPPKLRARGPVVVKMLRGAGVRLTYLRMSPSGVPWHPLYLPGHLLPMEYSI